MMIKLFFLAAASAMFMVYNVLHTQVKFRKPSSTATVSVPNVYSYQDIITTFDEALVNENIYRQNVETLTGMIATERARYQEALRDRRQMMAMASPYNSISQHITQMETALRNLKLMRNSNLDKAYMRLYFTYTQIQMPVQGSNKNLTDAQHKDIKEKIAFILAVKEAVNCEGLGYCPYPTLQQPYMMASLYAPPVVNAPPAISTQTVDTAAVAPVPTPTVLPEGTVEPQPEQVIIQ